MVAAGVAVDLGRSAEFTHGDHQGFLEQATIAKIVDQGRERLVGRRNQIVLEPAEDVFVRVPVGRLAVMLAVVNRDEPNASLDQAPGQENALPELVPAVTVAEFRVFRAQVKRLPHRRGVQEAKGLLCVDVAGIEDSPVESVARRASLLAGLLPLP